MGSRGWLTNWRKRQGISFTSVSGESGSVDQNKIDQWLKYIWDVKKTQYSPQDVFNGDETLDCFISVCPIKP